MGDITSKQCNACKEFKPLSEFHQRYSNHGGKKYGPYIAHRCKRCSLDAHKVWRDANPEKQRAWSRAGTLRAYGITQEQYDSLLASQEGRCAICRRLPEDTEGTTTVNLAVDHDHATGEVRGLLCCNCNRALGFFGHDADRLMAAVSYLLTAGGDEQCHGSLQKTAP